MNIAIMVTAYGGTLQNQCALSLLAIQATLLQKRIPHSIHIEDCADITYVRNALASRVVNEGTRTHLLFIDHDVSAAPDVTVQMLNSGKPLIGAVYPYRRLPITYAYWPLPGATPVDGLLEVRGLGMGFTLIERTLLETLRDKVRKDDNPRNKSIPTNGPLYGFFDADMPDGSHWHEDYAFCERWRTLGGGKVFALADATIGHTGTHTFRGNLRDHLKS